MHQSQAFHWIWEHFSVYHLLGLSLMNIMNSAVLKLPQHECTNTGIQHRTERARSCSLSSASPLQIQVTSVEQLLFQERQLIKMSEVSGQDPVCSQDWGRITAQHLSQIKGTVVVLVSGNAMYRVKMYWLQNSWWVLMSLKKGLIAETFFNVFIKFLLFNTPWSLWRSTYQHNHRLIHLSIRFLNHYSGMCVAVAYHSCPTVKNRVRPRTGCRTSSIPLKQKNK